MYEIKTVTNEKDLKRLFDFLAEVFYDEATLNKENYFIMAERFTEMKEQFKKDNKFLIYIEEDKNIIAGLTCKNMNKKKKSIVLSMLAVKKDKRKEGLGTVLIKVFEKTCRESKIKNIELGSRYRSCKFYEKLDYEYSLMVQVYDFITIEEIRKNNKYNFEEIDSKQEETYGFITYKVDKIKKEYVDHFENKIKTAYVNYIFKKKI